jgi:hypothetical protein
MLRFSAAVAFSVVLLAGATVAAQAQGPGSYAHLQERFGMSVLVDASFVAPDGCQTILSAARGAPPGVALGHNFIPATVIVGPDPRGCSGQRVLRRVFGIGFGSILQNVQLFFVSQDGRILKTEKLAIQTGW